MSPLKATPDLVNNTMITDINNLSINETIHIPSILDLNR